MDAPERISMVRDMLGGWGLSYPHERDGTDTPYILATPAALAASPEVQALIREAETRGMERAVEICEGIRTGIANGPMPEGARFDYEQAIRAAAAALRKDEETPK